MLHQQMVHNTILYSCDWESSSTLFELNKMNKVHENPAIVNRPLYHFTCYKWPGVFDRVVVLCCEIPDLDDMQTMAPPGPPLSLPK